MREKVAISGSIVYLGRVILVLQVISHIDGAQLCAEAAHALIDGDNFLVNVARLRQAPLRQIALIHADQHALRQPLRAFF